ncbi:MAG: sporulation protein YqfD [Clostridia bacterium]|nr:sporulation protein YqfD [Clostridia bacterium]
MIIEFIKYILGYIDFKAYGGLADRFLNLCTREKIPLWNIKNINGNIFARTTVTGYLSLKIPARKSGMKLLALDKKGLKFFLARNKSRLGFLIGMIAFFCVITVLSQFVWSISVVGNSDLDSGYIISAFENNGVRVGARISEIDAKDVAQNVVSEIPNLSWAAVNRKGSVIVIEVREKIIAPEIYDDKTPTNVVASDDGVVLSLDVLYGTEEIKPGWAVTKGDLLISGIVTRADGKEIFIHADGYVKALVRKKQEFSHSDIALYSMKNEKTRKSIFFFGIKIPLGLKTPDTFYSQHRSFLNSDETLLPLGIITEYGAEYSEEETEKSESLKEKIALYSNAEYVKELMEYSEIQKSSLKVSQKNGKMVYELSAECVQEIGELQEIYVEKSDDNT